MMILSNMMKICWDRCRLNIESIYKINTTLTRVITHTRLLAIKMNTIVHGWLEDGQTTTKKSLKVATNKKIQEWEMAWQSQCDR